MADTCPQVEIAAALAALIERLPTLRLAAEPARRWRVRHPRPAHTLVVTA